MAAIKKEEAILAKMTPSAKTRQDPLDSPQLIVVVEWADASRLRWPKVHPLRRFPVFFLFSDWEAMRVCRADAILSFHGVCLQEPAFLNMRDCLRVVSL